MTRRTKTLVAIAGLHGVGKDTLREGITLELARYHPKPDVIHTGFSYIIKDAAWEILDRMRKNSDAGEFIGPPPSIGIFGSSSYRAERIFSDTPLTYRTLLEHLGGAIVGADHTLPFRYVLTQLRDSDIGIIADLRFKHELGLLRSWRDENQNKEWRHLYIIRMTRDGCEASPDLWSEVDLQHPTMWEAPDIITYHNTTLEAMGEFARIIARRITAWHPA